jgi:acetoin utilization deacetylase AcuC-like enzyme
MTDVLVVHDPMRRAPAGDALREEGVAPSPEQFTAWIKRLAGGYARLAPPRLHGEYAIRAVHDAAYLDFLRFAPLERPDARILAAFHPDDDMTRVPDSIEGRAGVFLADGATVIIARTWNAACASANIAVDAAHRLLAGEAAVVALCAIPGRHAHAGRAAHHCYLNNAAIAASVLRERNARVAVLSIGRHHANGTQSIFQTRSDVFTVSIHYDPAHIYPFYTGYADEIGVEDGMGSNLNLPLPIGAGAEHVAATLHLATNAIRAFDPPAVVLDLDIGGATSQRPVDMQSPDIVAAIIAGLKRKVLLIPSHSGATVGSPAKRSPA